MKNIDKSKGIIVIGGHVQGLGITRILGRMGLKVVILDSSPYNLARHSSYCVKYHKYQKNDLLEYLVNLGKSLKYNNYIVLPTNDQHVELISSNKKALSQYFIVGTDDWDSVKYCYNKRLTYKVAQELGIAIPKTWMPDNMDELKNQQIDYPCIIKPAVMHSFYSYFKKKVFECNSELELHSNYKKAIKVIPPNEIIIQEIITGSSEFLYSACFLFDGENPINSFVGQRFRQHPPDYGNATTSARVVENDDLIKTSSRLLKKLGYKGVCEVEYKFDPVAKDYKLLEINPRTWKWHSITEKANIPMLQNYYNYLTNGKFVDSKSTTKATFRHLMTDIPMVIRYRLGGIYRKYPKSPIKYAVWDKNDLLPAIFEILYLPILLWKR